VHDTIAATLDVKVGEEVKFTFHVTNSLPSALSFASRGQTHELAVLDAQGREVWR
jgi:hypothetical protein